MIILIIGVVLVFNVKFDISGVDKLCDKLKKDLQSVKGARAGYINRKQYPNGLDVAKNALIQEYGTTIHVTDKMRKWFAAQGYPLKKTTTEIVIPPRPFLRKSLKAQKQWVKYVNEMFDANQDGHMTLLQIAKNIAEMIKDAIQESISSNIAPSNSDMTIARKKSSSTLIDTGLLRSSVQSGVIKK